MCYFRLVLAQDLKGSAESAEGISLEFHRVLYLPGPEVSRAKYIHALADPLNILSIGQRADPVVYVTALFVYMGTDGYCTLPH